MATKLTADLKTRVLLLEAGEDKDMDMMIKDSGMANVGKFPSSIH